MSDVAVSRHHVSGAFSSKVMFSKWQNDICIGNLRGKKCDLISAYDMPAENPRLIETYHFSDS